MNIQRLPVGMMAANCYIVYDEDTKDAVVVDPGGEPHKIEAFLNKNDLDLKGILLTHGHMDHIEGAAPLRELYKTDIYCHMDDEEMIENPKHNLSARYNGHSISITPDKLLADGEKISFGTLEFKVIHTPGHTKGSVCLAISGNCFTGDTIFNASIGRTDLYGGNHNDIIDSIVKKLFALDDETVLHPGHGPKTSIKVEKAVNPFVKGRSV
jgi:hydroxyacylglutathione hydrolase